MSLQCPEEIEHWDCNPFGFPFNSLLNLWSPLISTIICLSLLSRRNWALGLESFWIPLTYYNNMSLSNVKKKSSTGIGILLDPPNSLLNSPLITTIMCASPHWCIVVHINFPQQQHIFFRWMNRPSDDSSRTIISVQLESGQKPVYLRIMYSSVWSFWAFKKTIQR